MGIQYKKKCPKCKEYFRPLTAAKIKCYDCEPSQVKAKRGRPRKEVKVKTENKVALMVSNPKGYNKYVKNPNPKPVTQKEKVLAMSNVERNQLANELYRAALRFRRLANSCLQRSSYLSSFDEKEMINPDEMDIEELIKLSKVIQK